MDIGPLTVAARTMVTSTHIRVEDLGFERIVQNEAKIKKNWILERLAIDSKAAAGRRGRRPATRTLGSGDRRRERDEWNTYSDRRETMRAEPIANITEAHWSGSTTARPATIRGRM
jgi:hypothetical protein